MVKLNTLALFAILVLAIIMLAGCASEPAPPVQPNPNACQVNTDCIRILGAKLKTCTTPVCGSGACRAEPTPNCCGNNKTDEIEDGKPGSKCSCPADYGACEAAVKYKDANNRLVTAKYITRQCIENECVVEYLDSMQRDTEFFNVWTGIGFKNNIYVRYSNPFYGSNNMLEVEMRLVDYDDKLINLSKSLKINEIRLMEGTKILARITPESRFYTIGDTSLDIITVIFYDFIYPEEPKSLSLDIEYEYVPLVRKTEIVEGKAVLVYVDGSIERKTYTVRLTEQITFLNKDIVEE